MKTSWQTAPQKTKVPLSRDEKFKVVVQIMRELGFKGEITKLTEIPPRMVDRLTDQLVVRTGEDVKLFRVKMYPSDWSMHGVYIADLL